MPTGYDVILWIVALAAGAATAAEEGRRYDLVKRASEIDPAAREHPEIGFTFADAKGKPIDLQHAVVDMRVPSRGRLVIWLMPHSPGLFDRIAGYGLHGIQVAYANHWFTLIDPAVRDSGDVLGRIRLEAATGDVGGSPRRAHTCVIPGSNAVKTADGSLAHEPVWCYLFTHPVEQSGEAVPPDADCAM